MVARSTWEYIEGLPKSFYSLVGQVQNASNTTKDEIDGTANDGDKKKEIIVLQMLNNGVLKNNEHSWKAKEMLRKSV